MNDLSVGILHYGETEVLEETIKRAKQHVEHVVVARINLFDDDYGDVVLPWNFLITQGYAEAWNELFRWSPTEYMYILGAGKQIDKIEGFEGDYDTYATHHLPSFEKGEGIRQYKVGRVSTAKWHGRIHEEIDYADLNMQRNPTFFWSRFKGNENPDTEKDIIAKVYRWFSRVHWLYRLQFLGLDRQGTNRGWWERRDLVLDYGVVQKYLKHKHAIQDSRHHFIDSALEIAEDVNLIQC